jgi:hypothetical protein
MAAAPIKDPLRGPPPSEVPLKNAPLLRVIAQVRFPTLLAVRSADRVSGFQDAVRDRYPYLEQENVAVFPPGLISVPDGGHDRVVHWRFWDEQRHWRTTLNQDFLAIETTAYERPRRLYGQPWGGSSTLPNNIPAEIRYPPRTAVY